MVNIIVVFSKQEDALNIKDLLVRSGLNVAAVCTSGVRALSIADGYDDGIIVCGYKFSDMNYLELRENLPERFEMLLIASAAKISEGIPDRVVPLTLPLKVNDLINTASMLAANAQRRARKLKHQPKKRNDEENKVISDAKKILMEKNGMSEEEAHRYIQKTSMDSGTNMVETAEMVIRIMMN